MFVKEIKKLTARKAPQSTDKENDDIFGSYICDFSNDRVERRDFSSI